MHINSCVKVYATVKHFITKSDVVKLTVMLLYDTDAGDVVQHGDIISAKLRFCRRTWRLQW